MSESLSELCNRIKRYLYRRAKIDRTDFAYNIRLLYHPPKTESLYIDTLMFLMKNLVPRIMVHEWYCRTHVAVDDVNSMTISIVPSLADKYLDVRFGPKSVQAPRVQYLQWLYLPIHCDDSSDEGGDPKPRCLETLTPIVDFTSTSDSFILGDSFTFEFTVSQPADNDLKVRATIKPIDNSITYDSLPFKVSDDEYSDDFEFAEDSFFPGDYIYTVIATNCAGESRTDYPFQIYDFGLDVDICIDKAYDDQDVNYPYSVRLIKNGTVLDEQGEIDNPINVYLSAQLEDGSSPQFRRALIGHSYDGNVNFSNPDLYTFLNAENGIRPGYYDIEVEVGDEPYHSLYKNVSYLPNKVASLIFRVPEISANEEVYEYIRTAQLPYIDEFFLHPDVFSFEIAIQYYCDERVQCFQGFIPYQTSIYPSLREAESILPSPTIPPLYATIPFNLQVDGDTTTYRVADTLLEYEVVESTPTLVLSDDYHRIPINLSFYVVKFDSVVSNYAPGGEFVNSYLDVKPLFQIYQNGILKADHGSKICDLKELNICLCIEYYVLSDDGNETQYYYSGELFPVCDPGNNSDTAPYDFQIDWANVKDPDGNVVRDTPIIVLSNIKFTYCGPNPACNMVNSIWAHSQKPFTTPNINYELPVYQAPNEPPHNDITLPPEQVTYVLNSKPGSKIKFAIDRPGLSPLYSSVNTGTNEVTIGQFVDPNILPVGDHHFKIRAQNADDVVVILDYTIHVVQKPIIQIVGQTDTHLYNNDPGDPTVRVANSTSDMVPFITIEEVSDGLPNYASQRECFSEFLDYINAKRAALGVAPLTFNDNLFKAAYEHSLDMEANSFIGHQSSANSPTPYAYPSQRYINYGYYNPSLVAESVWPFPGGCENAIGAYEIQDDAHKGMFVAPKYKQIGIAFVNNKWTFDVGSGVYNLQTAPPLVQSSGPQYQDEIPVSPLVPKHYTAHGYVMLDGVRVDLDPFEFDVEIKIDLSVINFTAPYTWYYDKSDPLNPLLSASHSWRQDAQIKYYESGTELLDLHISSMSYGVHTVTATVSFEDKTFSSLPFKFRVGLEVEDIMLPSQFLKIQNTEMRPLSMSFSTTNRNLLSDVNDVSTSSIFAYTSRDITNRYYIPVFSKGVKAAGVSGPLVSYYFKSVNPELSTATSPTTVQAFWAMVGSTYVDGAPVRLSDGNFQGRNGLQYKNTVQNSDGTSKELRADIDTTSYALSPGWNFISVGGYNELYYHPRFSTGYNWQCATYKFRSTFPKGLSLQVKRYTDMEQYSAVTNVISHYIETRSPLWSSQPTTDITPTSYDTYDGIVRVRQSDVIKYPSIIPFAFYIYGQNYSFCTSNDSPSTFNAPTQTNVLQGNGQTYFYFKNITAIAYFEAVL